VIERHAFADGYSISRVIKGGWQLAGGHGEIEPRRAIEDMAAFVEAGVTTFDCADIYTGVEALIGDFRRAYPELADRLQVHTKFVPDLPDLPVVDAPYVERVVDRSLTRLGVERLDLVQFHWWDYAVPRFAETARELERLRAAGKIGHVGATNFDTAGLAGLVAAGIPVLAHQVQYSLLDDRPARGMVDFCGAHDIALLCYGTVAGGFLSDRWLGAAEPAPAAGNRSLVKYRLIIEEFGGWALYQELLGALRRVADRHRSDVATVATRAILDRPQVAAAIVGATGTAHLAAHRALFALRLDAADLEAIAAVTRRRSGPAGDVYALERDRDGRHGRIMRYALNGVGEKPCAEAPHQR
jgi:aryl-alcohol dehydrogenase-like predicted oxidoreductase